MDFVNRLSVAMLRKCLSSVGAFVLRAHKREMHSKRVGILGVPFGKGQKKYGVELAPSRLREAGLLDSLKEIGTIDGHYNYDENVVVLWVDAHADINTNKTSGSGSVHGMPLALLARELSDYWPYLPGMDWQVPRFSIRNLAYIGLRSVDKYERLVIEKYGVPAFGMEEVQRLGIPQVVELALRYLDPRGEKSIHVSFDIDSLDKLEAPSTGTCVRGGLTLREGVFLMEQVYNTGRLDAIDLVEVNPMLGGPCDVERTLEAAIEIIKAGLGFSRKGAIVEGDLPLQTFKPHSGHGIRLP